MAREPAGARRRRAPSRDVLRHPPRIGVPSGAMTGDANRVWVDTMPAAYDRWLVPTVFHPFAVDLARRAAARPVGEALELAAGTGVLTRELVDVAGAVTATDLNAAMVEVGARRVPAAQWQQADAMQLPFDDGSFDLVACQFGVMFFPDRPAAYAGIARLLRPGGRFLFNAWAPLATHDVETTVIAALAEAFPDDPPSFLARVPHGYTDPELVAADLTRAGFDDVQIDTVELQCTGKTAAELALGYCRGTPLRPEI